jgi:hypothetical protein
MSEDEIITKLFKRFDLDDVENVSEEDLTIEPSDNGIVISIDYEVRTPTIGNVDIVVVFAESAEISR